MALRDECTDDSRTGEGVKRRASYVQDIDTYHSTLWEQKLANPDGMNATRGAADIR